MSILAVIEVGGSQHLVTLGETLALPHQAGAGKELMFTQVLLVVDEDQVKLGEPYLKDTKVVAQVLEATTKGPKLRILRYKAKSRYRRVKGYRDTLTVVKIVEIAGVKLATPKPKSPAKKPVKSVVKKSAK